MNTVQALTFGTISNATVQVSGIGPAVSDQRVAFSGGQQTVVLTVTRLAAGQSELVPITVTDGCGPWQTFVGAGPTAG
jgi:hypothetical protein